MDGFFKNFRKNKTARKGQTATEYLLMLAATAVVVMLALRTLLPLTVGYSNEFFNRAAFGLMGIPAGSYNDATGNYYKARTGIYEYP